MMKNISKHYGLQYKSEFLAVFGTQLGQPRHAKLQAVRSMQTVLRTRTHVQRT